MFGEMLTCLLSGSRPVGAVLSIAGMWHTAPASMNFSTTAEPSAPVPPVTTICRSCSVCISTPINLTQDETQEWKRTRAAYQEPSSHWR